MSDTALLQHLRTGERLVWGVSESAELKRAWVKRTRQKMLLVGVGCLAVGAYVGYQFYGMVQAWMVKPDVALALTAPVFFIFGIALIGTGAGSLFALSRFTTDESSAQPFHYALTDHRIFIVDPAGAVANEIAAADIASVSLGADGGNDSVIVRRRGDTRARKTMFLLHLADAATLKTKIEETFPEPAHD